MANDKKNRKALPSMVARQRAFLSAYAICGNIFHSAKHAGINRQTHLDWLVGGNAEDYQRWFEEAKKDFADQLLQEAKNRAINGTRELVLYRGQPVFVWCDANGIVVPEGTPGSAQTPHYITKVSDTMLAMMLNGHLPEKFHYQKPQFKDDDKEPELPIDEVVKKCLEEAPDASDAEKT